MEHLKIEKVTLTVGDLEQSIDFYKNILGFTVVTQSDSQASLGTPNGDIILDLIEDTLATLASKRETGLYHFAILVPKREDLAAVLKHIIKMEYPLVGASDHHFSEAIYLEDPDHIGIEIYADRPKQTWNYQANGDVMAPTLPLDVENLFHAYQYTWTGFPNGTIIGHLHFHVASIGKARAFYVDQLGMDVMMEMEGHMLFVSGQGYHHHIGLNTWHGTAAKVPDQTRYGIHAATLQVDNSTYQKLLDQNMLQADWIFDPFAIAYQIKTWKK